MTPPAPPPAPLAPLADDPGRAGVLCDFDGTLSAIVPDPSAARPLPGTPEALAALAARYARVAVVSGRPAAFLAEHLGAVEGLALHGLYGLEAVVGGRVVEHPGAKGWRPVVEAAAAAAEAEGWPGVVVERKGSSLTLHWRRAAAAGAEVAAWAAAEAARSGLAVRPARMSAELHPPVAVDKGTVVAEAAAGLGAACFLGDDSGDLAAFDALDALGARGAAAVRVAVASPEAPPELLRRADLLVDGPPGALALLRSLASAPAPGG